MPQWEDRWEATWHLDKRVPIALIITLFLQLAAGIWWASSLARDVAGLKEDVAVLNQQIILQTNKYEKVIQLQGQVEGISSSMARMERTLESIFNEAYSRHIPRKRAIENDSRN